MKILIIGAKGMLGGALADVFNSGHDLFLWDREEIDITQNQQTTTKILDLKPDLVINASAYNDVDQAENDPLVANSVNGVAVGNLAKVCKELDIGLVHYSTDYVFDGKKQEGYVEIDQPNPQSVYGRSKYLGEQETQKFTNKYYIIRLSKLFGKPAKSATGKKSFVELMLALAETKDELDVVDEEVSCPTYAPDLADFTKSLLDARMPYGIYHGVNEGSATWYGFAKEIFRIKNITIKLNPVPGSRFPRPAKRPQFGILHNTKGIKNRLWTSALEEYLTIYE